jgi:hypothetical protein
MSAVPVISTPSIDQLVEAYVKGRDKKAQLKAQYDAACKPIDEKLDKIEQYLLGYFSNSGLESVRTQHGTAYVITKNSATLSDKSAFKDFVTGSDNWALADLRVSKVAVEQYIAEHQNLPPGVDWRSERVVNFRRS